MFRAYIILSFRIAQKIELLRGAMRTTRSKLLLKCNVMSLNTAGNNVTHTSGVAWRTLRTSRTNKQAHAHRTDRSVGLSSQTYSTVHCKCENDIRLRLGRRCEVLTDSIIIYDDRLKMIEGGVEWLVRDSIIYNIHIYQILRPS
jgi:hypothetical protein